MVEEKEKVTEWLNSLVCIVVVHETMWQNLAVIYIQTYSKSSVLTSGVSISMLGEISTK